MYNISIKSVVVDKTSGKKDKLKLNKTAIKVCEETLNLDVRNLSSAIIDNYNLQEYTNKPYYVVCTWTDGENGSFCSKRDILDMLDDIISRLHDNFYALSVYDAKTCRPLELNIKQIELKKL